MQIQNNYSNTSFSGGYYFSKMPRKAKFQLETLIKKGKQIFYDFEKQGDVFLVVRDERDRLVNSFVKEHKLSPKFYPQISTKSGLDSEKPELLKALIDKINIEDKKVFDILNEIKVFFGETKSRTVRGARIITDIETGNQVVISPLSKNGANYVQYIPKGTDYMGQRYAIMDGKIVSKYTTPNGIRIFDKNFHDTLTK